MVYFRFTQVSSISQPMCLSAFETEHTTLKENWTLCWYKHSYLGSEQSEHLVMFTKYSSVWEWNKKSF